MIDFIASITKARASASLALLHLLVVTPETPELLGHASRCLASQLRFRMGVCLWLNF